jgi:hypothetical protein
MDAGARRAPAAPLMRFQSGQQKWASLNRYECQRACWGFVKRFTHASLAAC